MGNFDVTGGVQARHRSGEQPDSDTFDEVFRAPRTGCGADVEFHMACSWPARN